MNSSTPISTQVATLEAALGEAFSSLIYLFECSDDPQASKTAKEAADKIEIALTKGSVNEQQQ